MSFTHQSFNNLVPRMGSKEESFEELCCQIARQEEMPLGSSFVRIRGAGGDGGVECLWCKPDGTQSGWQAKFIFDFERALNALSNSLATALQVHPALQHYVVCLPYDLTGNTSRRGKGQLEKFDEWKEQEIEKAAATGRILNIELKTSSILLDRLTQIDPSNGKIRFWFDETVLGPTWFRDHIADVKSAAGPRYSSQLTIDTPVCMSFEALCDTPRWRAEVTHRLKKVKEVLKNWELGVVDSGNYYGIPFPPDLYPDAARAVGLLKDLLDSLTSWSSGEGSHTHAAISQKADQTISLFIGLSRELRNAIESEHGQGKADDASWKQFMASYQMVFPAQHYDNANDIISACTELRKWIDGENYKVNGRASMLLTGHAGVGKTHAICDAAIKRFEVGLLTVICFAEALPGHGEVADNVRAKLGLPADIGRDELLSILNSAGELSGGPLLIALDGLNESQPRSYWIHQLPTLVTQLSRFPFLRLCVSCRTTYVDHVVPRTLDIPRVDHLGFTGSEFEALCEYCRHYGLEYPATPFLSDEFSNGLFLKLFCEATRDMGSPRIPNGTYGIRTAIDTFLAAKDQRYSQHHGTDVRHRYPSKAVRALANEFSNHGTRSINFDDARAVIARASDGSQGKILEWLIEEGLIRIDAVIVEQYSEDHVFLPFERLGDHLLAERFLVGESPESVKRAFTQGGKLEFLLDKERWNDLAGLREAIALQISEVFGVELAECAPDDATRREFDRLSLRVLTWRDASAITSKTSDLLNRTAQDGSLLETTFEQQLLMSLLPSAIDAYWLDRLLKDHHLPKRDRYWCKYLHLSFEKGRAVRRLIEAAFKVDTGHLSEESVERWIVVLGWFCAAADRRVRDGASKAMVRLLTDHPCLWKNVISNFWSVDDDYIVERTLVATYGAMLRNPDQRGVKAAAEYLIENLFDDTSKRQNALIRDHARCITELALHIGALENFDTRIIEPPYESDWPLIIPTETEIGQLKGSINELPALYRSCFSDDFFTYTLSRIRCFEDRHSRTDMAAWIFQEVFNMGYDLKSTIEYDGVMLYEYGGGRGRPTWAERIGKKYQWIALARLVARLGDHVTPIADSWQNQSLVAPLVYANGRDIDASLVSTRDFRENVPSWWSPYSYPFGNYVALSDKEWVALASDIPDLHQFVQTTRTDGGEWVHLCHYPEWTSRLNSDDADFSQNYRLFWLQVESHLVDEHRASAVLRWAEGANWFNLWMPQGRSYNDGFVGEYPFGIAFHLSEGEVEEVLRPDNGVPCPTSLIPTVNGVSSGSEFDCYQPSSVRVNVPSQSFFSGNLHWQAENGFQLEGKTVFIDPALTERGPSALLVDKKYLEEWLASNGMCLFFTLLGEKLCAGDNDLERKVVSAAAVFNGRSWHWSTVSQILH